MNFSAKPGKNKKVGILGVPLGFGAGQTGSELGGAAIRLSKIRGKYLCDHIQDLGYEVKDYGDVNIAKPNRLIDVCENPRFLPEMEIASSLMANSVKEILRNGEFPIILGGDHSIAIGTFSGISSFFHEQKTDVGLIWFDAHADINTHETSLSGNIHGMPLAAILGHGKAELVNVEGFAPKLKPQYCAHVGARDLDAGEQKRIHELGLRENFFTMSDIDRRGMLA
ncbi:MAG: arginase, partial [Pyrinomonadaceae bacterium]|nr:arginase [Pyrinomonadaceae bacterium]